MKPLIRKVRYLRRLLRRFNWRKLWRYLPVRIPHYHFHWFSVGRWLRMVVLSVQRFYKVE